MDSAITVEGLGKSFQAKHKEAGLVGSLKSLVRPTYHSVTAVDDISFKIRKGDLTALIGPNGAGKSTILKMLTGILHPDHGTVRVAGLDPQRQRTELAMRLGTVFGQKPQLWYHLPAIDTFDLFSRIYELDRAAYASRLRRLAEFFQINSFMHTPVRKLSLGQRMRAEIVASLLHKPQVLFLDEPTIGLDITTKKRIRHFINEINKEEDTTIILTSHDMQDIEKICRNVMIINDGRIIYEGSMKELKKQFLTHKIVSVLVDEKLGDVRMKGVTVLKKALFGMKLSVDTSARPINSVIKALMKKYTIVDITISDPPVEDMIENILGEKAS